MPTLPSTLTEHVWLLACLAIWAGLLVGGFVFGHTDAKRERRMPTWTRMGASLALVVAAWSWWLFTRGSSGGGITLLVALGMSLGCAGDFFLAGLLPVAQPVLVGIAAFGLGHVAYIAALLRLGGLARLDAAGPRWAAEGVWLALGLLGWYLVVGRGPQRDMLRWAALPYALLLASTAGVATGLALAAPVLTTAALGGALFLLSDLILAGQLFGGLRFPLIGDAIWLTYGPAQALLVFGIGGGALALLVR